MVKEGKHGVGYVTFISYNIKMVLKGSRKEPCGREQRRN